MAAFPESVQDLGAMSAFVVIGICLGALWILEAVVYWVGFRRESKSSG